MKPHVDIFNLWFVILETNRWRRSSGHSFGDYSDVAKESLVHRVCKMDKSLASSGIQVDLVETLGRNG